MTIVNFTITDNLDKQVRKVVEEKGFQSKAELFRFALVEYIKDLNRFVDEDEEFAYLEAKLAGLLSKKFANKKLPSLKKQLENI